MIPVLTATALRPTGAETVESVPTAFTFDQEFAADPADVLAMLQDPEYVRLKAERTGGRDVEVGVETADGALVVICQRVLPADVPSYARSFVGESITVTERQVWGDADEAAVATATVTVDFHAPVAYAGRIDLTATSGGSAARNSGQFRASVPLIGGKVERLVAEQTERYLTKELQVAREWLSR